MDVYKHILIRDNLKSSLKILEGEDLILVKKIYDKSNEFIKKYEWQNKTCVNPEPYELGKLKHGLHQSLFQGKNSLIPFIKDKYINDLNKIISQLNFSQNLINAKILLMRRGSWHERTSLENELNTFLIEEFKKEFINNNSKIFKNESSK